MTGGIKVLIADDHAVVREGIAASLNNEPDINIVAKVSNGNEAISKTIELKPDVIIMDISMPVCSGLEATSAISQQSPQTKVLIFTISDKEEDLFRAVKFGARGYLLKSATLEEITNAIRQIHKGEAILSSYVAGKLLDEFRKNRTDGNPLSQREGEVLSLVGEGLTNREIAEKLIVSPGTVKTYLQRILEKLHLNNRAEAMAYALKRGLIQT